MNAGADYTVDLSRREDFTMAMKVHEVVIVAAGGCGVAVMKRI